MQNSNCFTKKSKYQEAIKNIWIFYCVFVFSYDASVFFSSTNSKHLNTMHSFHPLYNQKTSSLPQDMKPELFTFLLRTILLWPVYFYYQYFLTLIRIQTGFKTHILAQYLILVSTFVRAYKNDWKSCIYTHPFLSFIFCWQKYVLALNVKRFLSMFEAVKVIK